MFSILGKKVVKWDLKGQLNYRLKDWNVLFYKRLFNNFVRENYVYF